MTAILYINDNHLRLQPELTTQQAQIIRSQSYAWFKDGDLVFDIDSENPPIKYCRLAPQEMNNRYWSQCEKSSIANNSLGMRHAADLIWKHVSELQKKSPIDDLILVVPSHYQSSNLQLLLGIMQSLGINVVGLVNGALLSLVNQSLSDGEYQHVDVQLHQTVNSRIRVIDGVATLDDVDVVQHIGIQSIQDAFLKEIQAHFIQNDRFDPLHYAETEQQLFDKLSSIASQANESGKAVANVEYQGQRHSTNVDAKTWHSVLAPFWSELSGALSGVDQAFIQMNNAFERTAFNLDAKDNVRLLDDLVLRSDIDRLQEKDSEGSLNYITELMVLGAKPQDKTAATRVVKQEPKKKPQDATSETKLAKPLTGATHLMQAGIAIPIEHSELKTDNSLLTLHASSKGNAQALLGAGKVFVMGDETRKELRPNDRLGSHLGEGVITVIQVV